MSKLNIGRIPVMKGEFVLGNSYNRLWQVTYLGSTYQSKIDNNTSIPAAIVDNAVVHRNTDKWVCIADATKAVNSVKSIQDETDRAKNAESALLAGFNAEKARTATAETVLTETTENLQTQVTENKEAITANKSEQDEKNVAVDESLAKLDTRSTQMEETIKTIAASGGASTATAVTYDNAASKLTAINVQAALDEVKGLVDNVQATTDQIKMVEVEGYILAFTDSNDTFLGGITTSGLWYIPKGIPEESRKLLESLQSQIDEMTYQRDSVYTIDENGTYLLAIKDQKGICLGGITKEGKWDIPSGIPADTEIRLKAFEAKLDNAIAALQKSLAGTVRTEAFSEHEYADFFSEIEPETMKIKVNVSNLWLLSGEGTFDIVTDNTWEIT